MICHEYLCNHVPADTLNVVHNESSNAPYCAVRRRTAPILLL